jgi:hypothetical protein
MRPDSYHGRRRALCPCRLTAAGPGQQDQDRVDLASLEGIGEARHLLLQLRVAERPQRPLLVWRGQPLLDVAAGAVERAVH